MVIILHLTGVVRSTYVVLFLQLTCAFSKTSLFSVRAVLFVACINAGVHDYKILYDILSNKTHDDFTIVYFLLPGHSFHSSSTFVIRTK